MTNTENQTKLFTGTGIQTSPEGDHVYARWCQAADPGVANKGLCTVIGLHPATNDIDTTDPTLESCRQFATNAKYETIALVNLFSAPGLNTSDVRQSGNPIGAENDLWVANLARESEIVIVAWGDFPWIRVRARQIQKLLGSIDLYAVQLNANGTPTHPKAWKRKAAKLYRRGRAEDTLSKAV